MTAEYDPLEAIWQSYLGSRECLQITSRSTALQDEELVKKLTAGTRFALLGGEDQQGLVTSSERDVEEFAILSLWAAFERFLVRYIQEKGNKLKEATPSVFAINLYEGFSNKVEYWRLTDILDLFKGIVTPTLLGEAKQIKRHRDWIAHRNPRSPSPAKIRAIQAYEVLSEIIGEIVSSETS